MLLVLNTPVVLAAGPWFSHYTEAPKVADHRGFVGGAWDLIGPMQLAFLKNQSLRPDHALLDMGCGSLRGGRHFVGYLDKGRYYGIDINQHLLEAGYSRELGSELQEKLPRENLHATADYNAAYWGPQHFDYAISVSLWTHLPLSEIRRCLQAMKAGMRSGGQYFSSVFVCEEPLCQHPVKHNTFDHGTKGGSLVTYPDRDPYHQSIASLAELAASLSLKFEYLGDWGALHHPRSQMMTRWTF